MLAVVAGVLLSRPGAVPLLPQLPTFRLGSPELTTQQETAAADPILHGAAYELAFTRPTRSGRAEGDSPVEQLLLQLINRANETIDVAIYDIDLEQVTAALARAAGRGIRVRMVIESDEVRSQERVKQAALTRLRSASIPLVEDRPSGTMHNKFMVVDGRWVETGSWNYTFSETWRNNNNAIVIESKELAANYTAEFEKMFVGHQFGGAKPRGSPNPVVSLAGARAENYFSPEDRAASQVIRWIGASQQRLHFLAFAFTHNGIADAMLERSKSGIPVGGVFEGTEARSSFSQYNRLLGAGLDVLLDANPWNLHHKVIVEDGRVVMFGSFNFSASADRDNDENLLIVEDPGLAAAFEAEYERIRADARVPR